MKGRPDKIFNNTYHTGQHLKDDFTASGLITINNSEFSGGINELVDFDSYTIYQYMQKVVVDLTENDPYYRDKFDVNTKKKFNKDILNEIFGKLRDEFTLTTEHKCMFNVIYLFDILSSMTGIKTKTLFDFLKYDYKKELIVELDKTTNILRQTHKMF